MSKKFKQLILPFLLLILTPLLMADISPRPIAFFEIINQTDPPRMLWDFNLTLCETEKCKDPYQLQEGYMESFECAQDECVYEGVSTNYDYLFITFTFPDGPSIDSNVIVLPGYPNVEYTVVIRDRSIDLYFTANYAAGKTGRSSSILTYGLIFGIAVLLPDPFAIYPSNKRKGKRRYGIKSAQSKIAKY